MTNAKPSIQGLRILHMTWPLRRSVYGQLQGHSPLQALQAPHSIHHHANSRQRAADGVVGGSGVQH
eukprot:5469582-Pyramimonas_sp.AAC.1